MLGALSLVWWGSPDSVLEGQLLGWAQRLTQRDLLLLFSAHLLTTLSLQTLPILAGPAPIPSGELSLPGPVSDNSSLL